MPVNLNNIQSRVSVQAPVEEQGNWFTDAASWWERNIDAPMWRLGNWLNPGEQAGEKRLRELNEQGIGGTASWQQAMNETTSGWGKFGYGMLNPLYYLPVAVWGAKAGAAIGGVAKGAMVGGKAAQAATGLSKLSPALGSAIAKTSAIPFAAEKLAAKGVGKVLGGVAEVTMAKAGARKLTTVLDKRFTDRLNAKLNTVYEHKISLPEVKGELTHDQVFKAIVPKSSLGTAIVRELSNMRVVGKPVRTFTNVVNGRILQDDLARHVMAEDYLFGARGNNVVDIANQLLPANPRRLFGLGSEPVTSAGARSNVFAKNVTLTPAGVEAKASTAIGDIIENWKSGWYKLTPEQEAWVKNYHAIMDEWNALAKKHGVNLLKYKDPEDTYHFFRMGYGKIDERTGEVVRFSKSGSPVKPRIHKTQAEGVADGVVYNADPIASAQATATWINKKIRDERIASFIKPYSETPTGMAMKRMVEKFGTIYKDNIAQTNQMRQLSNKLTRIFTGSGTDKQTYSSAQLYNRARLSLNDNDIALIKELGGDDLAKVLGDVSEAGVMTFDETVASLTKTKKLILDEYEKRVAQLKELTPTYRKYVDYYKAGSIDETKYARIIDQPMFNGRVFPKEIATSYRKGLGLPSQRAKDWITTINKIAGVSRVGRTLVASMDFSAPFIQGLPALGADPIAWAKATAKHYRWFFNQSNFSKVMMKPENRLAWEEAQKYGLRMGKFEYYAGEEAIERGAMQAGAKIGGVLGEKASVAGAKLGRGLPRQTLGRGESAFSGFGDAQRLELWKSLRYRAKTEEELMELAQSINKMTGFTEMLGVSQTEKALEQAFIFAPRYTRAGFEMIGDIFRGGLQGELARESLGHMMAGGALWYMQMCKIAGVEPNFDPASSGFMTLRIGGQNIGIGGFMLSVARFGADLIDFSMNIKDMEFAQMEGETWDEYATRLRKDIPFLKFMYQKSAPLVGVATEITTGTDYFGQEIEGIEGWARWFADKTLPIAMQSVIEGDFAPAGVAAQFAGLREFPISPKEKFYDEIAKLTGGVQWKNLDKSQRRLLLLENPELEEMKTEADQAFAIGVSGRVNMEFSQRQDAIEAQYDNRLQEIANAYEAGKYSGKQFRDAVGEAEAVRRGAYDAMAGESKFAGIYQAFQDPGRVNTDMQFDAALFRYRELIWDNDELTDDFGNFDYAKFEENKAKFNREWPGMEAQIKQYVDLGRMGEPEAIADLRKARTTMSPYFGIKDHLLQQAGLTKTYTAYSEWVNLHPTASYADEKYLKDMLGLTPVLEQVSNYQKQIREQNNGQNIYNYYYTKYYS